MTNEYYRFNDNLQAQISIDEKKAKGKDVDAMVRLARYFLTGETICFDPRTDGYITAIWYETQDENGDTYIDYDMVEDYLPDEATFKKGEQYAKMAADANDPRGNYLYSRYVQESVRYYDDEFNNLEGLNEEFLVYLKKAAEAGYDDAQIDLAVHLLNKEATSQEEFVKAEELLKDVISKNENNRYACLSLGKLYNDARNQSRSAEKALDCFAKIEDWEYYFGVDAHTDMVSSHFAFVMSNQRKCMGLSVDIPFELAQALLEKLSGGTLVDFCIDLFCPHSFKLDETNIEKQNKLKVLAYERLNALAEAQDAYAQYRLGGAFFDKYNDYPSESEEEFREEAFSKEECLEGARKWLLEARKNGQKEAVVRLALLSNEYGIESVEEIDKDAENYDLLLFVMADRKEKEGDYKLAFKYYKMLMEKAKILGSYASQALKLCEALNDGSAEEFVANLFDWATENQIKNVIADYYGDFIVDDIVPRLLDKESKYYDPSYAIRILQCESFSSSYGNYLLGCIFADGEYVEKNIKQAAKYFKLAAQDDIGEAYYRLAYLFYYGDGHLNVDLPRAKEYFEKAIFCGVNCQYAYEMVRSDLKEKDESNPMKEYAEQIIEEAPSRKERNERIMTDMAADFGEHWERLQENTRDFIYSGVKTYVNNYEDDDPKFDFSAAINPMAKSLEYELGEIFYKRYKQWLRANGVENIKEYFTSLGVRISSGSDPFEMGVFRYIAYERKAICTDYETARKLVRANNLPAIVRKSGKEIYRLSLHTKFAEYANEIFREDAFSKEERQQEITAFIIDLVSQVEDIRESIRNRASHDTVMKANHAEKCGNILYKTKKVIYSLISKLKD